MFRSSHNQNTTYLNLLVPIGFLLINTLSCQANPLKGTTPLDWEGDIASKLVDAADAFLLKKIDKPVFEMREIELGATLGETYEVLSGLEAGEEIVAHGTFTVDAAAQLQGKKSMMNKDGGKVMTGHEGHLGMDNNASNKESDHTNMNERLEVSEKFSRSDGRRL